MLSKKKKTNLSLFFGEKKVSMRTIFAEFISPVVSHLHHSDPTANKIHFKYPSKANFPQYEEIFTENNFQLLHDLSRGSAVEIKKDQMKGMRMISILLCNQELYNMITENDQKNADLYLEELLMLDLLSKVNKANFFPVQDVIDSLSSKFSEIETSKLFSLPKRILHSVISNEHLKIESEDALVDFIHNVFSEKKEEEENEDEMTLISFYEEVEMGSLSDEKFREVLLKIDASKITARLWSNICNRFCNFVKIKDNRYLKQKERNYLYDGRDDHRFDGIISQLTKECGESVHEKGIVEVTASSEENDSCRRAKNAVLFNDTGNWFCSKDMKDSWLRYDFKKQKVRPTHYSIKSKPYILGDRHPQHWVIEGSNNGRKWKILDTRRDVKSLNGHGVTCTFKIQEKLEENEFYQFLRIKQTGLNTDNNNRLGFSFLEFFGSII